MLSTTINKKIIAILISTLGAFGIIFLRLIYLQIHCGEYFSSRSQKNFIRYSSTVSPRGNILDVHGNLLATNRPLTTIYWQGTGKNQLTQQQISLLHSIENITGAQLVNGSLYDAVVVSEKRGKKIELIADIDLVELSKLLEAFPNHENIVVGTSFKRLYPYNTCCSHLVGYLGNMTTLSNGKFGLEKLFDADLCGKNGSIRHVVNSIGQCISQIEVGKSSYW